MKKSSLLDGVGDQVLKVPAYTLRAYDAEIKLNQNEKPSSPSRLGGKG